LHEALFRAFYLAESLRGSFRLRPLDAASSFGHPTKIRMYRPRRAWLLVDTICSYQTTVQLRKVRLFATVFSKLGKPPGITNRLTTTKGTSAYLKLSLHLLPSNGPRRRAFGLDTHLGARPYIDGVARSYDSPDRRNISPV
jgi:hypothetical protein